MRVPDWATAPYQVIRELVREWSDDRVSGLSAEVAFFAILSLFPGFITVASALGFLQDVTGGDVADQAESAVLDFLRRVLTSEASETITAVESLFREQSGGLLTFGLLTSIWALSRGFAAVIRALDVAYDVDEVRSWWRLRATALAMGVATVIVSAVLLAMVVLGPLLGTGEEVADEVGAGGLLVTFWDWLRIPVVALVLVAWATSVFHFGPASHTTPWRWDLPGALATAALAAIASLGMRVYLVLAAEGNQVFGVLGGALVVLLWLYLLSASLLIGAELNAVLAVRWGIPTTDESEQAVASERVEAGPETGREPAGI